MMTETTTIATTMLAATLPAASFFFVVGIGSETKLFRTPHRGQADNDEPYLQPQIMQSMCESLVR